MKINGLGPRLGGLVAGVLVAGLALTGCGSGDAEADGATRTVKHAMGTTKVPEKPKRVVVLDTDKYDSLISLGVKPVGIALADQSSGVPEYLKDELAGVKQVGTLQEPDVEAIAELEPDLILGSKFRQEKYYGELAKVAPTVFTEMVGVTWKANFLLDAEAIGKKTEGQQKLQAYETRAKELGKSLGDPAKLKVSVIRFMPDEIRQYGPESFSGIVLNDVGVGRPEPQLLKSKSDKRMGPLSPERIAQADGDIIFVAAYGEKAAQEQTKVTAGPLWQKLSAVKAGHAHVVDDGTWMTGIGVTSAGNVLDDLSKYLRPLAKK